MFDLQVLAWQADITRVTTLLMAKELSNAVYPKSGVRDAFHILSHHSNIRENKDRFAVLNRYHVGLLTYLLGKLKATPDGDGTLLDHSMVLYGSAMGDGNQHNHVSAADRAGRRGLGPAEGRASHPEPARHHDVESAAGDARQARRSHREIRRQHGDVADLNRLPEMPLHGAWIILDFAFVVENHRRACARDVCGPFWQFRCIRIAGPGEGNPRVAHLVGERHRLWPSASRPRYL